MFAFITNIRAKAGQRVALARLTQTMMEQTAIESGVPVYVFHQAEDDPDEFWFYDLYTCEEAYREHCSRDAFNAMISQVGVLGDIKMMHKLVPYGSVKSERTYSAV